MTQRAFGLNIPQTLEDVCDPTRLALIVYDMQVGIVNQIENGHQITDRVLQVLKAARAAGIRVFFTRPLEDSRNRQYRHPCGVWTLLVRLTSRLAIGDPFLILVSV